MFWRYFSSGKFIHVTTLCTAADVYQACNLPEDEVDPVVQVGTDEGALQRCPVLSHEVVCVRRPSRQLYSIDCRPILHTSTISGVETQPRSPILVLVCRGDDGLQQSCYTPKWPALDAVNSRLQDLYSDLIHSYLGKTNVPSSARLTDHKPGTQPRIDDWCHCAGVASCYEWPMW